MSITNADGIVTPDEGTVNDPVVYLSAMADSISEGIGERLTQQEQAIGLKASIVTGTRVKYEPGTVAPYEIIGNGTGCFVQGLDFLNSVATVTVAGMYFITAAAALNPSGPTGSPENSGRAIALQIMRNGVEELAGCEVKGDATLWQTAQANTVVLCIPGDTLHINWYSAGPEGTPDPTAGALISDNPSLQSLSIVLITPVAPAPA